MIKSITATNHLGEAVKIVLSDAEPDHGFLLMSMTGLGPAKANINTTTASLHDGSVYNSARLEDRNIVIKLRFTNDIETTRQLAYRFFPVKKPIDLVIETDNHTLTTTGHVESNEPDIFSQTEGCQISIICPDPYFYLEYTNVIYVSVNHGSFEFPFESPIVFRQESYTVEDSANDPVTGSDMNVLTGVINQVIEEESTYIEFGYVDPDSATVFDYYGTSDIGVFVELVFLHQVTHDIVMFNALTKDRMVLDIAKIYALVGRYPTEGDVITLNTKTGEKYITFYDNGEYINILSCIQRPVEWLKIAPGENIIQFSTNDIDREFIKMSVYFNEAHDGV